MNDTQGPSNAERVPQPSQPMREPLQPSYAGVGVSLDVNTIHHKRIDEEFVYSAKFLCGKIPHSLVDPQDPPAGSPAVPGTYRTAINVHNPNRSEIRLFKMAVTTNPEGHPRGKAGDPVEVILGPNEGIDIDCDDIEGLLTTGAGTVLFNTWNIDAVASGPPADASFQLSDATRIKQIATYHWNGGMGKAPGRLGLIDSAGALLFDGQAQGSPGQGGVQDANWVATFDQLVPAGTYTVYDDDRPSWSFNARSGMAGFYSVSGSNSFVGKAPFFKGFVVIRCRRELDVVGVYTVKNVIATVPTPRQNCPKITPQVGILNVQPAYTVGDTIRIYVTTPGPTPFDLFELTLIGPSVPSPVLIQAVSGVGSPYAYNWIVKGLPYGTYPDCMILARIYDANHCLEEGNSQVFTLNF